MSGGWYLLRWDLLRESDDAIVREERIVNDKTQTLRFKDLCAVF